MLITKHRSVSIKPIKLNVDYILSCVHSLCPYLFNILNPRQIQPAFFLQWTFEAWVKKADKALEAATKGIDISNVRS